MKCSFFLVAQLEIFIMKIALTNTYVLDKRDNCEVVSSINSVERSKWMNFLVQRRLCATLFPYLSRALSIIT